MINITVSYANNKNAGKANILNNVIEFSQNIE